MMTTKLARFTAATRGPLLFALIVPLAGAQSQTWIRQLGTSNNDSAYATAPDGSGGVYVTGVTSGSLGGPSAGDEDPWIARYDATGSQAWIQQLGTIGYDSADAIAPDGSGGVYVTGDTTGSLGGPSAGNWDVWLARYDATGSQTWIQQLGTIGFENAHAVAPDGSGGVYVTGDTSGSLGGPNEGNKDAWIARYDATGSLAWIRQLATSSYDSAVAAVPDGSGGVYVTGDTSGSLGGPNTGDRDVWLARYDVTGGQTWIRQLGASGYDVVYAGASDGSGGVYVTGVTSGSLGGLNAGFSDAWIARYDATGSQTWIEQLGTSRPDNSYGAAPDGSGGVYVTGSTSGSLGGPNAGSVDSWIARYDATGHQTWIQQLGTFTTDSSFGAAPDGSGGVYVTGATYGNLGGPNAGGNDAWLALYDGLDLSRYCTPAIPNSTGLPGRITAVGNGQVAANDLTVIASQLPLSTFGFFLTSRDQASTFPLNNSQGRLCLGGFIGRYVGPGQIQNSGANGSFSLALDLTAMAHPQGPVSAQVGQTWNFQAWHRDANPMTTSNLTDAVAVTFR